MLAVRDHVPGLRALLAEQAMRADFDLDFIDDVRLAVDEVCALALANCTQVDVLTIRLLVDAMRVRIEASVRTSLPEPRVDGLSLRVLQALADSLDHGIYEDDAGRVFYLGFGRSRRTIRR
jgi:serine/threonine-protein kinase RsbW